MTTKINAATRLATKLSADRDTYQELDWHKTKEEPKKEPTSIKTTKQKNHESDMKIIDGLRAKIKEARSHLKDLDGTAKDAKKRLIDGMMKRANEIWKRWDFAAEPLYKSVASTKLRAASRLAATGQKVMAGLLPDP